MDITSKYPHRSYELTYLVPGAMNDADVAQIKTEVETALKKFGGSEVQYYDWGKKSLAYVITHEGKKQRDAYYNHMTFKMDSLKAQDFEQSIFLMNKIMRHLLLVGDGAPVQQTEEK